MSINRAFLNANHAALVAEILAEGHAAGRVEGLAVGAEAERARIQSVEAQALPGHADLIASLKFDGKTTGPEAAAQVLAAERNRLGKRSSDINADAALLSTAAPSVAADPAGATAAAAAAEADQPLEQRLKATWDKDASLRAEYGDNFKAYEAYEKNRSNVRVLGQRKSA